MRLDDLYSYYYFEYDIQKQKFIGKGIVPCRVFDYIEKNTVEYLKNKKKNKYFRISHNNLNHKLGAIYVITKKAYEKA